jgi:hypothetical protein
MVKRKIKWTTKAIFDKISILEYWANLTAETGGRGEGSFFK